MIDEQISQIRRIVTTSRMRHKLMATRGRWLQIVCCMDTVEDAQLALEALPQLENRDDSEGLLYLAIYGALQAVFIQQDAVGNLAKALELPFKRDDYPGLKEIREVRHQIVGHPTEHKRGKVESYHAISRESLSAAGFRVLSSTRDGQTEFRSIDLQDAISANQRLISRVLVDLRERLEAEVREHKAKFRDKPLLGLFPPSLGYDFEKLHLSFTGSRGSIDRHLAVHAIEVVGGILSDFNQQLTERGMGIDTYPGVELVWNELQYPVKALRFYFGMDSESDVQMPESEAAQIFADYLERKIGELKGMCAEIDADYNSDEVA